MNTRRSFFKTLAAATVGPLAAKTTTTKPKVKLEEPINTKKGFRSMQLITCATSNCESHLRPDGRYDVVLRGVGDIFSAGFEVPTTPCSQETINTQIHPAQLSIAMAVREHHKYSNAYPGSKRP